MKRLALAVSLISAVLLSGCIVVPAHRYYHDHRGGYGERGYDGDRDDYYRGRR